MKEDTIEKFLKSNSYIDKIDNEKDRDRPLNEKEKEKFKIAKENFMRSCAGYCVATYVYISFYYINNTLFQDNF